MIHLHLHGVRSRDQGAQGTQGTTGTAYGGRPRRTPRPMKPPGAKAGGFTVDNPQPRLPGMSHEQASQQHAQAAQHYEGLNYGTSTPLSRAHSEASKAHKTAHQLYGKPGYAQAAHWANSATEHAKRLAQPVRDAAKPEARQGPKETGPDIKAGSNSPQPTPRPPPEPYRGYADTLDRWFHDAPGAAPAPKAPAAPKPPAPPSPASPRAPAAPQGPSAATVAAKPFNAASSVLKTGTRAVEHATGAVERAAAVGEFVNKDSRTIDAWFRDAGTPIGGRRGHSRRRHNAALDEAEERTNWLDAWFRDKQEHAPEGGQGKYKGGQFLPGGEGGGGGGSSESGGGPTEESEKDKPKKVTKQESPCKSLYQDDPPITEEEFYDPANGHLNEDDLSNIANVEAEIKAEREKHGDTQTRYKGSADGYTPSRRAKQKDIIARVFNDAAIEEARPPAGEKPKMIMLGGRGGSGKSMFTEGARLPGGGRGEPMFPEAGVGSDSDKQKYIVIDSDKIKKALGSEGWDAALYHEESTDVVDEIIQQAIRRGLNVVLDATLKTKKSAVANVDLFAKTHDIEGHYMHCPRVVAARNAVDRFKKGGDWSGRFVPPAIVLSNTDNEANFDDLRHRFSNWSVWDNPTGKNPTFYASKDKPD